MQIMNSQVSLQAECLCWGLLSCRLLEQGRAQVSAGCSPHGGVLGCLGGRCSRAPEAGSGCWTPLKEPQPISMCVLLSYSLA